MVIHPRSEATNRYPLFKEIFGEVKGQKVFDFGGGGGNLLYFSKGNIDESKYTCVDVSNNAIIKGKNEFPNSNFFYYDRYNWMYNHNGELNFNFPELKKDYDIVWSYSVFSHTDYTEFSKTIQWFVNLNAKKIACSFLIFNEMLEWAYNKRCAEYNSCIDIKKFYNNINYKIIYLFDNNFIEYDLDTLYKKNCKYLLTFYNKDFIYYLFKKKFDNYNVSIVFPGDGYVPFLFMEKRHV